MQVTIISDTIQEFEGRRYYLCGAYFQSDGVRLHRQVWERANGKVVPEGFHVHHKDHDRSNNQPGNLELVSASDHMRHHHEGHDRGVPAEAIEAARAWHGSDAGREWHRAHYERTKSKLHVRRFFVCEQCGADFAAPDRGINRFCSNRCKTKWRKEAGLDDEVRQCVECKAEFTTNKYSRKQTCSRKCSGALSGRKRRRKE